MIFAPRSFAPRAFVLLLALLICAGATRAQVRYEVVYDQLEIANDGNSASTFTGDDTAGSPWRFVEVADDFDLRAPQSMVAARIKQSGLEFTPETEALRLTIYGNDPATERPGAIVCRYAGLVPELEHVAGDPPAARRYALMVLPRPCRLPMGSYWFSVMYEGDYDPLSRTIFQWVLTPASANSPVIGRNMVERGRFGITDCPDFVPHDREQGCFPFGNDNNPSSASFQLLRLPAVAPQAPARVDAVSMAGLVVMLLAGLSLGLAMLARRRA
jgi:hypothetical protein